MSLASKVGQVTFQRKSGSYMPAIMCDKGDLYQEYDGESSSALNISPDFTVLKPVLAFMLTSSRVAEGIVNPQSVKWYFNDTLINFSESNVSTNSLGGETGHFKNVPYQAGVNNYYSLQIVKNLVKASGGASISIKAVAKVTVGNTSDEIQFVYAIPITRGVGSMKRVTIMAGDNNYFAIRTKGGSCILKAFCRLGADELTSGLTYTWSRMLNGQWSNIASVTTQTLTVNENMVDTTGIFRVEVFQGGTRIGYDTQTVLDLSDPYDILPRPTPDDETIVEKSGGTVVYEPYLVKRGSVDPVNPPGGKQKFLFTFYDSAGVVLNPDTNRVPSTSGTCTEAMCVQASGNVNWVIQTSD